MSKYILHLSYPQSCRKEREWIVNVLLTEFLGVEYVTEISSGGSFQIEAEGKELIMPDIFFSQAADRWLAPESLPQQPLQEWDYRELRCNINLITPVVPIIFGDEKIEVTHEHIRLRLDVFGSAFFMLSRYEEVVKDTRDQLDRFPALASLAYQEGFINRPIINEYLEILWGAMKQLWPGLQRKKREARTLVSCDIDVPYAWGTKSLIYLVRQMGGDLILRKNPIQSIRSGLNYFFSKSGNYAFDIFYSMLDRMMSLNEKAGNKVAFYFIAADTTQTDAITIDGCYSLDEFVIRNLMRSMSDRGHEIGLHFSYNTYQDQKQMCREAERLRNAMQELGISQDILGSRQHILRWSSPTTARNLEAANMDYDTTLTFADHAGFRCGVCYEYSFYDVVERRVLNLRERPLVVMEKSVFDKDYMGSSYGEDGLYVFKQLKQNCYKFDGDFTILWHNNQFPNQQAMEIYQSVIQ